MNKYLESYYFIGILILFLFLFYAVNKTVKYLENKNELPHLNPDNKELFQYLYMGTYAVFVGLFVFYGFKSLKPLFHSIANNEYLGNLMITSFITGFSLAYAGFIEDILQNLLQEPLDLNPWKNLIGWGIGRLLVIIFIFIIIIYYSKNKK